MDVELYDEFGNYIGPDIESDSESGGGSDVDGRGEEHEMRQLIKAGGGPMGDVDGVDEVTSDAG